MKLSHWILGIILGSLAIVVTSSSVRAGDKDVEAILADWKRRQHTFDTVRYTVTGTVEFKDKELPPGNPIRPKRAVLLLDLKTKHSRLETTEDVMFLDEPMSWKTFRGTSTFDGKESRSVDGEIDAGSSNQLSVAKGQQTYSRFDLALLPLFYAHGAVQNNYGAQRKDKWPIDFDPENFEILGKQTLNGRTYQVMRTVPVPNGNATAHDEFWIDQDRASTIVRSILFGGKDPWVITQIDWQQIGDSWIPKRWTETLTNHGTHRITRLEVVSFEANPKVSDLDFTIPALPGMLVHEQTSPPSGSGLDPGYPAKKLYKITPTGSIESISEKAFTTFEGTHVAAPSAWRPWWPWCAVAGLAAIAFFFVYMRIRRSNRRTG